MTEVEIVNVEQELEAKLREEKIRREIKRVRLRSIEDQIGFWVNKLAGGSLLGAGALETITPDFLPIAFQDPLLVLGGGFGLLAGKKAIDLLSKIFNTLGDDS